MRRVVAFEGEKQVMRAGLIDQSNDVFLELGAMISLLTSTERFLTLNLDLIKPPCEAAAM
jgi:hypothetical protein